MKRQDVTLVIAIVIVAATLSYVVSSTLFKSSQQQDSVPVIEKLSSTFPDPANDPAYQGFFNTNAIDPAQAAQIGNQHNNSPFRGSQ